MTLKPSYLTAFLKTFLWTYALVVLLSGISSSLEGKAIAWGDIFGIAGYGGAFLGLGVVVMFTPQEIEWDSRRFKIRTRLQGSGEYPWDQLEAYSGFGRGVGTFLIKFKGRQAYQIVPAGFSPDGWHKFQELLRDRFPEKKTWIWIGPFPVRFGRS